MYDGKLLGLIMIALLVGRGLADEPKPPPQRQESIDRWLGPQDWARDVDGPIVELGPPGQFDDTHIFAPCAARIDGEYLLWYSGSSKDVANRVFSMGLAVSDDGRAFHKHAESPVLSFGDGRRSVLTPALLRGPNGECVRENHRLRMWFAATDFAGGTGVHTLHEAVSADGVEWSEPSAAQLENVYAPTILKQPDGYQMWYTDVSDEPWVIRAAVSQDGRKWTIHPEPVVTIDQSWEKTRLFYPYVLQTDDVYLMWYGSYWSEQPHKTALGFAVSADGLEWHKHPQNPVFRPDPARAWESHYTTSQSVVRFADGSFRIWYASRKAPPFVNKYFAIGTARWDGP